MTMVTNSYARFVLSQEQTRRSQMLETLQDELGKFGSQHEKELEIQRKEHEKRQEERQHSYREKVNRYYTIHHP